MLGQLYECCIQENNCSQNDRYYSTNKEKHDPSNSDLVGSENGGKSDPWEGVPNCRKACSKDLERCQKPAELCICCYRVEENSKGIEKGEPS